MATNDFSDLGGMPVEDYSDLGGIPASSPVIAPQQQMTNYQNFPQGFMQGANQAGRYVQDIGAGIGNGLGGVAQGGEEIGNAMTRGINDLFGINLPKNTTNYTNQFTGPVNPSFGDKVLQGTASFVPYAASAELTLPEEILGSRLLGQGVVGQGLTGSVYGATQSNNPISGGITGAIENIAMGIPGMVVSKALNGLAGNLTSDELAQNVAAAQGTNTGLGAVINSPTLKFGQKVAMAIPFGGGQTIKNNITNQITNQGSNLLNNLSSGISPENVGENLNDALQSQLNSLQNIKRQNYKNVEDLANQSNTMIGRTNFSNTANGLLDKINQSDELKNNLSPGFVNEISSFVKPSGDITINSPILNVDGIPISSTTISKSPSYSLQNSNIFKGILNDKASDAYAKGDNFSGSNYASLAKALGTDIDNGISNSDNQPLQQSYADAQKFYKDNISPWEDPSITKFTRGNGDADTLISSFVKPGLNNDRGNLINTLVSKLPPEQQSLPGYAYLSRANVPDSVTGKPTFDPIKFSNLYNNIGPNTKDALFGNGPQRQQLDQYNNLIGMNKNILASNVADNQHKAMGIEALAGILGGEHLGIATTLGLFGGLAGGANIANRLLTKPSIRNVLINRMQNPVPYSPGTINKFTGGYGITPSLTGLAGNQNINQ